MCGLGVAVRATLFPIRKLKVVVLRTKICCVCDVCGNPFHVTKVVHIPIKVESDLVRMLFETLGPPRAFLQHLRYGRWNYIFGGGVWYFPALVVEARLVFIVLELRGGGVTSARISTPIYGQRFATSLWFRYPSTEAQ